MTSPPAAALAYPPSQQAPRSDEARRLPVEFTGTGAEYFRIWIVNVALSIVTLGIYSAWAKVRTKDYFYRHTVLDGSCFQYHALPRQILKGRIIVGVAFATMYLSKLYSMGLYAAVAIIFLLLTPVIFALALAFNARNSSYRNVRFGFAGTIGGAFRIYFMGLLLNVVTIGLGFPYVQWTFVDYWISNHRYGHQNFQFSATAKNFYFIYLKAGAIAVLPVAWVIGLIVTKSFPAKMAPFVPLLIYVPMFFAAGFVKARQANLVFGSMALDSDAAIPGAPIGAHRFEATQKASEVMWLMFSNLICIAASLGLLIPWAKVRMARYRAAHLFVLACGDLIAQGDAAGAHDGLLADAATDFGDIGFDVGF